MHVRCTYCNQSFNLTRDFLNYAYNEALEKDLRYYGVECVNCRKLVRVPVEQMQRFLPDKDDTTSEVD